MFKKNNEFQVKDVFKIKILGKNNRLITPRCPNSKDLIFSESYDSHEKAMDAILTNEYANIDNYVILEVIEKSYVYNGEKS